MVLALSLLAGRACGPDDPAPPKPPVAAKRPFEVESPHGSRTDEYYWLRDDERKDPDVLAYLEAENAYKEAMLAPLAKLRAGLKEELAARLVPDDSTVPYRDRGYFYSTRYVPGQEYPLHVRRKDAEDAPEEVMLDVGEMAEGHEFYSVGSRSVSPSSNRLAFGEDTTGRRQYTLRIKDLTTGEVLADAVPNTTAAVAWVDDETLLYIEKDPVTLLGCRVKRHRLGSDAADDPVIYEEKDHSFYMGLGVSADRRYVLLVLKSTTSDEVRFYDRQGAAERFEVLAPRAPDIKVLADHIGDRWIIRTNWDAEDYRLMQVGDGATGDRAQWRGLIPARDDIFIQDFELFDDYLVVAERVGGGTQIRVRNWSGGKDRVVKSDNPAGTVWLSVNREADTKWLRFGEGTLVNPREVHEIEMATGETRMLRRDPVGGDFDPARYRTERMFVEARDGTPVPVTLAARHDLPKDGTAPMVLYGYGAYGSVIEPRFRPDLMSLLDRGVLFAVAHIRGGQEMGRAWYDGGRLHNKPNTFTDFVDVAEGLVAAGHAHPQKLVASGGSAGGLLVGAAVNLRPDLFSVAVAHVPFVDVVTTMLDESIPLTTNEYKEWGDPREREFYETMLSYSPYDNIKPVEYPAMLVTGGLWDSQVQYFEPAKWVARLRDRTEGDSPLLMHMDMSAGHGGASGRYRRLAERAMEYAFILDQVGAAGAP